MSNPYIVGGWVSGALHYGRRGLISHLLEGPNHALWVVGTRRVGKTSLLRQIEALTLTHPQYVPLYVDLQGISTRAEFNQELHYALDEVAARFDARVLTPLPWPRRMSLASCAPCDANCWPWSGHSCCSLTRLRP